MRNSAIAFVALFLLFGAIAVAMGIDKGMTAVGIIGGIVCAAAAVLLVLAAVQSGQQLRARRAAEKQDTP